MSINGNTQEEEFINDYEDDWLDLDPESGDVFIETYMKGSATFKMEIDYNEETFTTEKVSVDVSCNQPIMNNFTNVTKDVPSEIPESPFSLFLEAYDYVEE